MVVSGVWSKTKHLRFLILGPFHKWKYLVYNLWTSDYSLSSFGWLLSNLKCWVNSWFFWKYPKIVHDSLTSLDSPQCTAIIVGMNRYCQSWDNSECSVRYLRVHICHKGCWLAWDTLAQLHVLHFSRFDSWSICPTDSETVFVFQFGGI